MLYSSLPQTEKPMLLRNRKRVSTHLDRTLTTIVQSKKPKISATSLSDVISTTIVTKPTLLDVYHECQQKYEENPDHHWISNEKGFRCETNPKEWEGTTLWTNSRELASMIESRSEDKFREALQWVTRDDVRQIDVFLPVLRLGYASLCGSCSYCGYKDGPRCLSIIRLWLGVNSNICNQTVLKEFFNQVILRCGWTQRFNERVDCSNRTALEWIVKLKLGQYEYRFVDLFHIQLLLDIPVEYGLWIPDEIDDLLHERHDKLSSKEHKTLSFYEYQLYETRTAQRKDCREKVKLHRLYQALTIQAELIPFASRDPSSIVFTYIL